MISTTLFTGQATIQLGSDEITWAVAAAEQSLARWADQRGYYTNRFNAHFKGRLGELAAEQWIRSQQARCVSHFRYQQRERLCDLEAEMADQIIRLEVKTWSAEHWATLGRCVAVDQLPQIGRKADRVVWCVVQPLADVSAASLRARGSVTVRIAGWSAIEDVRGAPIRWTGHAGMRLVRNHQLAPSALRSINTLLNHRNTENTEKTDY